MQKNNCGRMIRVIMNSETSKTPSSQPSSFHSPALSSIQNASDATLKSTVDHTITKKTKSNYYGPIERGKKFATECNPEMAEAF
ncbi:hypothetical protein BGZ76_009641 [Entomortierella beljakovae]|nr:hypothetical protein BGZ76_009641 [Entomortierella beljakovae]